MSRTSTSPGRRARLAATVAAGALALVISTLTALPAQAATPPPAENRLGGFTDLTYVPGDAWGLAEFRTADGFPGAVTSDGFRVIGMTPDGSYQDQLAANRTSYGGTVGDQPTTWHRIVLLGVRWGQLYSMVSVGGEFTVYVEPLPGGAASIVSPAGTVPISSTAKYYSETFVRTATGIVKKEGTTPTKTATTTTVAASGITETSATLTATVAPTAATGTVQFTKDGTNVGAPAAVANGQASVSVSDLTAGTAYTFGAAYSGDTTHDASTGSVQATTVAGPPPADSSETDVTVTVPQADAGAPTGLKISTAPAPTIALTGPATRAAQQEWVATGQLGAVTVTDDRRDGSKSPWTLTGAATAFTAGTNQIPAAQLTWTPSKTAGAGTAGTAGPITTAKQLATGAASATANVTTTVAAGLSLAVPASAAAGEYTAKLTLTLI